MYNVINFGIHIIALGCLIYAFMYNEDSKDLKILFALIGGFLILTWGFFVGELYNLRSLFNVLGVMHD